MKILLILGLLQNLNPSIGVAENEHYINFIDGTGYYVEEQINVSEDNLYFTIGNELYVIK